MHTVIILGAGQSGRAFGNLLNKEHLKLLAYGDNNPKLYETSVNGVPVMSVEQAVSLSPQCILIGVISPERSQQLQQQAAAAGFQGKFIRLHELYNQLDIRSGTLYRTARRIIESRIPGNIAELGVYKGDTACKLNALFPDRRLYLFDTFEGFDTRDIAKEKELNCSRAAAGDFSDTTEEAVLARMAYPKQIALHKGFFPQTAAGLENETYALVSLDADLYAPLLAGLEYFYPRLSPGGIIFMHDYNNERFRGAKQAVEDYEKKHGQLLLIPLCDLHGSAVIIHP